MIILILLLLVASVASGQVFPTAVATDANLLVARDVAASTLAVAMNSSQTSFTVATASSFAPNTVVKIDNEQIFCLSFSGLSYSSCQRGFAGTPASAHNVGAEVRGILVGEHHNRLSKEVQAIEGLIGVGGGNVVRTSPGAITAAQVAFGAASGIVQGNNSFVYDSPNGRLCVGCSSWSNSTTRLRVASNNSTHMRLDSAAGDFESFITLNSGGGAGTADSAALRIESAGIANWAVGSIDGRKDFELSDLSGGTGVRLRVGSDTKQVEVLTTDGKPLWLHNDDGAVNPDLWIGKLADASAPAEVITSLDDGSRIHVNHVIQRPDASFYWSNSASIVAQLTTAEEGDSILHLFRTPGYNADYWSTGTTDTGWGFGSSTDDDYRLFRIGGGSSLRADQTTGNVAIGRDNTADAATLTVRDAEPTTGATLLQVQAGPAQAIADNEYTVQNWSRSTGITQMLAAVSTSSGGRFYMMDPSGSVGAGVFGGDVNGSAFVGFGNVNGRIQWQTGSTHLGDPGNPITVALKGAYTGAVQIVDGLNTPYFIFDGPANGIRFGGTGADNPMLFSDGPTLNFGITSPVFNWVTFKARDLDMLNSQAGTLNQIRIFKSAETDEWWGIGKDTDESFYLSDFFAARNKKFLSVDDADGHVLLQPASGNVNIVANVSGNATATGRVNFGAASSTAPIKFGTSLPATCSAGDLYFKTDATAGENLNLCTATDTWTLVRGFAGASGGGVYQATFTAQDPLAIPGATHALGACPARISIFTDDGTNYNYIENWNEWSCNKTTFDTSIDFPAAMTGVVVLTRGSAISPGGSGTQLQHRDGSGLGGVGGSSVSGSTVTSTGVWIFNGGTVGLPIGTTVPVTCAVGDIFFDSDASAGTNVYGCTATNTWTLQGDGGGGGAVSSVYGRTGAVTAATADYTAAQVTNAVSQVSANVYTAGIKSTFKSDATTAGFRIEPVALPSSPASGDCQTDLSDGNKFKCWNGGSWDAIGGGGAPSGSNGQLQVNVSGSLGGFAGALASGSTLSLASGGRINGTSGSITAPNSTTLPVSCNTGDLQMDTDRTPLGQQLYICNAGAWSLVGDGGSSGGSGCNVGNGIYLPTTGAPTCAPFSTTSPWALAGLDFSDPDVAGTQSVNLLAEVPTAWNGNSPPDIQVTYARSDGTWATGAKVLLSAKTWFIPEGAVVGGNSDFTSAVWNTEDLNDVTPTGSDVLGLNQKFTTTIRSVNLGSSPNAAAAKLQMAIQLARKKNGAGGRQDTLDATIRAVKATIRWTTGTRSTTSTGTTAAGTTVVVANPNGAISNASQKVFIAGAGAAGENYVGTLTTVSGSTFTITPATSTSVPANTLVIYEASLGDQTFWFSSIGPGGGGGGGGGGEEVSVDVGAGDGIYLDTINGIKHIFIDPDYVATQGGQNTFSNTNYFGMGAGYLSLTMPNDTSTGTEQYKLVSMTSENAILSTTANANWPIGVCLNDCGISGMAEVGVRGRVTCLYQNTSVAGNWVVKSTTNAGQCQDTGSTTKPTSGIIVGRADESGSNAGYRSLLLGIE